MSKTQVAQETNVSLGFVSQIINGHSPAPPNWVDMVADLTKMNPEERVASHRKAGDDFLRRRGYRLDLTKDD